MYVHAHACAAAPPRFPPADDPTYLISSAPAPLLHVCAQRDARLATLLGVMDGAVSLVVLPLFEEAMFKDAEGEWVPRKRRGCSSGQKPTRVRGATLEEEEYPNAKAYAPEQFVGIDAGRPAKVFGYIDVSKLAWRVSWTGQGPRLPQDAPGDAMVDNTYIACMPGACVIVCVWWRCGGGCDECASAGLWGREGAICTCCMMVATEERWEAGPPPSSGGVDQHTAYDAVWVVVCA